MYIIIQDEDGVFALYPDIEDVTEEDIIDILSYSSDDQIFICCSNEIGDQVESVYLSQYQIPVCAEPDNREAWLILLSIWEENGSLSLDSDLKYMLRNDEEIQEILGFTKVYNRKYIIEDSEEAREFIDDFGLEPSIEKEQKEYYRVHITKE